MRSDRASACGPPAFQHSCQCSMSCTGRVSSVQPWAMRGPSPMRCCLIPPSQLALARRALALHRRLVAAAHSGRLPRCQVAGAHGNHGLGDAGQAAFSGLL